MKEALAEAVREMLIAEHQDVFKQFSDLVMDIRAVQRQYLMHPKKIDTEYWKPIRNNNKLMHAVMATTQVFLGELTDVDASVVRFANTVVPFTPESSILAAVDLEKAPTQPELVQIFRTNLWWFFLSYAAQNLRVLAYVQAEATKHVK
jgi:hypothetical protein